MKILTSKQRLLHLLMNFECPSTVNYTLKRYNRSASPQKIRKLTELCRLMIQKQALHPYLEKVKEHTVAHWVVDCSCQFVHHTFDEVEHLSLYE